MNDNGTAIAVRESSSGIGLAVWNQEELEVIRTLICPGASDAELSLFAKVCQRTGLDAFSKQIYGIMRWDNRKKREVLSIQTSIDGFRLTAERSGKYDGQAGPQWCGMDAIWRDVWLEKDPPAAARVGVYRTGWSQPTWAVATWQEYVQTGKEGQPVGMWRTMPANQLAKCAESLALRKGFPQELSGLYSKEEMAQADNDDGPIIDIPPRPVLCDAEHFNRAWHATVKGTRFEDEETRHKFLSWYTKGSCSSLVDFLQGAAEGEATDLIGSIKNRIEAEAKKAATRAALEDEARQVIEDARDAGASVDVPDDLGTMSDAELREMIDPLKEALASLEAAPS